MLLHKQKLCQTKGKQIISQSVTGMPNAKTQNEIDLFLDKQAGTYKWERINKQKQIRSE